MCPDLRTIAIGRALQEDDEVVPVPRPKHRLLLITEMVLIRRTGRRRPRPPPIEPVRHLAAVLPPRVDLLEPNAAHEAGEVLGRHVPRVRDARERELYMIEYGAQGTATVVSRNARVRLSLRLSRKG